MKPGASGTVSYGKRTSSQSSGRVSEREGTRFLSAGLRGCDGDPKLQACTWAHTYISQQGGRVTTVPHNSCYSETSPALCKAFSSDRFTHVPFVILQPFRSGILDFIFILIVGLIVEPFRCSPFYRDLSVIRLKGYTDPEPPFCCFYYRQRGTTLAVKLGKATEPGPGGI